MDKENVLFSPSILITTSLCLRVYLLEFFPFIMEFQNVNNQADICVRMIFSFVISDDTVYILFFLF